MKKIEIKVQKEYLLLYEKFGDQEKGKLELAVQELIGQMAERSPVDYVDILKEIRKNAESRGFTDDILDQILNEE